MENFLSTIIATKKAEVQLMKEEVLAPINNRPSFYKMVKENPQHIHVIGEVKRASPSKGDINLAVDSVQQAIIYQEAGVSAISVLTDETFFKGTFEDLTAIANQVDLPILCKDFIVDVKQLYRASNAGASIVLLIVAALDQSSLVQLFQTAQKIGLEVLVEVHNLAELTIAERLGAKLIGVNNRNLSTFEVSLDVSYQLGPDCQSSALYFSESGIREPDDVEKLAPYFNGVLVGETLMRAANPKLTAKSLQVSR